MSGCAVARENDPLPTAAPAATISPQPWQEVGSGSASAGGISSDSGRSRWPDIAAAADGTLYIAWHNESDDDSEIYIKRWTAGSWQEVGGNSAGGGGVSNNEGESTSVSLAVSPDGVPYLAWRDWSSGASEIYVRRWDGHSWQEVGAGSAGGGGISKQKGRSDRWPSTAFAADGTFYVAWNETIHSGQSEIYVRRWDGRNWQEVGQGSADGGGISNDSSDSFVPSIAVAPDGSLYVAWVNEEERSPDNIFVKRWNGAEWEEVGPGSAIGHGISRSLGNPRRPHIAVSPGGVPYVVWSDDSAGDREIYVRRWNGHSWQEVGAGSAQDGGISHNTGDSLKPTIAFAPDERPYVRWYDKSSGNNEVYVRYWDGSAWLEAGPSSATGGGISDNSGSSAVGALVVSADGVPYITWSDRSSGNNEIYVRRWQE